MSKLAELYVTIRADSKQLAAGLQSVKGLTAGVAQNITNVGVAAAASFYAFERAARYVLGAYAAQEEAELRLRTAIRLRGMEGMGVEEMVVQFANARQAVTTFGDEVTMQAAAMALRFNAIRRGNLEPFLKLAQDLAAMTRQDLSSAVMSLGMALENPSMGFLRLRRAGIMFTVQEQEMIREMVKLGKTADAQAAILDKVKSKVEGMAEAYAKTFAGRAARIGSEIGDMAENLGQVIADKLGGSMEKLIVWLTKFKESMVGGGGLVPGLVKMVGATLGFATAIAVAGRALVFFRTVLFGSLGPLGWIAAAVAALAAKYVNLEDVMEWAKDAWKGFTDWLESKQKVFDEIKASLTILGQEMLKLLGIDKIKLGEAWEWLKDKITEAAEAVLKLGENMADFAAKFVKTAPLQWEKFKQDALAAVAAVGKYVTERMPRTFWTAAEVPAVIEEKLGMVPARREGPVRMGVTPRYLGQAVGWAVELRQFRLVQRLDAEMALIGEWLAPIMNYLGRGAKGIKDLEMYPITKAMEPIGKKASEVWEEAGRRGATSQAVVASGFHAVGEAAKRTATALGEQIKAIYAAVDAQTEAMVAEVEWRRELEEKGKGTMGGRQGPPREEADAVEQQAIAKKKKKEHEWATGFVGLADFAKQFQAAVLKPDKALALAERTAKAGEKNAEIAEDIRDELAKRYSAFGAQLA